MKFTLEKFIKLNHSKKSLQQYFKAFKKFQNKLIIMSQFKRRYMPCTFDEMMVNLGYHAERKELRTQIEKLDSEIEFDISELSNEQIREKIKEVCENVQKLSYINNPFFKKMTTHQNALYRRIVDHAIREKDEEEIAAHRLKSMKVSARPTVLAGSTHPTYSTARLL